VTLELNKDDAAEEDETLTLQLQLADGPLHDQASIGTPDQHQVTITEDSMTACVSGTVWGDANGDGVRQAREMGIPGVLVTLVGADSRGQAVEIVTTTDDYGVYEFAQLPAGTYDVRETQPQAFYDGNEKLGASESGVHGEVGPDRFQGIVVGPGQSAVNYHFAEVGVKAGYTTVKMILASTPAAPDLLRATTAQGEAANGDLGLADAIRQGQPVEFRRIGSRLTVTGSGDADQMTFTPADGDHARHIVTVNGMEMSYPAAEIHEIALNGSEGLDRLVLRDSAGDDQLETTRGAAMMIGENFHVEAIAFELVKAVAAAGGDDTYRAAATDFVLQREGSWNTV
jgi:hypothetical protein